MNAEHPIPSSALSSHAHPHALDDLPRPLRGPIGLKQLFCFDHPPLIRQITRRFKILLIGFIFAGVSFETTRWLYGATHNQAEAELFVTLLASYATSELIGFVAGFSCFIAIRRWILTHRLPEIYLTELRPFVIAQIILGQLIRIGPMVIASAFVVFSFWVIVHQPEHAHVLLRYAFIAVNFHLTLVTGIWIMAPLALASKAEGLLAGWRFLSATIPLMMIVFLIGALSVLFFGLGSSGMRSPQVEFFALLVIAMFFLLQWPIKLLYARAFAAKIEQTVFPQLEL